MARPGVSLGLGAQSTGPFVLGPFVPRVPEKWAESRRGYCLGPQDWARLTGLVATGTSLPKMSDGGSSCVGTYQAMR